MTNETYDAMDLYAALENMLGDWYLFCLNKISRDDVNAESAHDAMKVLKRLQGRYRAPNLQSVAIATKPKESSTRSQ